MSFAKLFERSFVAIVTIVSLLAFAGEAKAEKMRINTTTKLRAQPGEAAKVLKSLNAGDVVKVLGKKGRWLRVRIGKRTGWVTQTTVEPLRGNAALDSDGAWSGQTKKRQSKEKKAGQQASAESGAKRYVTIKGASMPTRREPNKQSREVFVLGRGDIATVEGRSDNKKWLLVQNEDGQFGWVRRNKVKTVTDVAAVRALSPRDIGSVDTGRPRRSVRKSRIIVPRVETALGFRGVGMNFTSNGTAALDEYLIQGSSALTQISAWVPLQLAGLVVEVGGTYAFSVARPGIQLPYNMGNISYLTHDAHLSAQIGYRFMDGLVTVAGSGGYHMSVFRVDQPAPPVYLPSERLTGITAGGIIELAPLGGALTLRGGGRALIGGQRAQTAKLEDGEISTAGAWWAHVDVDYAFLQAFDLVAGYTLERATTQWAGPSVRRPGVTAATRIDTNHLLYLGVGRAF